VADTKNELRRLRTSIEQTKARIDALNRRESSAMRSLSSYQRQRHNLTVFIAQLEADLVRLQDTARVIEARIADTRSKLDRAETSWRETSLRMLAYRTRHQGMPPSSLRNDVVYRSLTASLTSYRRMMLMLSDSLASQKDLLDDVSTTQQRILTAKERERTTLAVTIDRGRKELQRLRSNKKTLEEELRKKQASARRVRTLINDLVAKERATKAEEQRRAQRSKGTRTERPSDDVRTGPTPQRGAFRPNSLPWPTPGSALLHGSGTYRNPETGTILENPGIDIKAPTGTRVTCVARGKVSSVTWLPGYGSLVIVDHNNGFRTVYANLATVNVRQGGAVDAGTVVGTSGENIDGTLVHFEVWFGRERQNPLTYLR
jgi:septal ring factor EnvC (AmiA/AmiB activator)